MSREPQPVGFWTEGSDPAPLSRPLAAEFRDRFVDQLRPIIEAAIKDGCPVWTEQFDAGPGLVVGVPDAALIAAQAVIDARWYPGR